MSVSPPVRILLWPLSLLYGAFVRLRVWLYAKGLLKQKRLNAPVVSVGNLTVGGTGKTPMVIWIAEKLLAEGKHVAILSRGYRGANGTSDEIELMKFRLQGRVVFGVGKDRFSAGQRLETQQPIDVFLLDDGFQHLQLARDLDILLMDASRRLAGESLLPAGRLREPLSAMSRANILVFTRTENMPETVDAIQKLNQFPVFAAATQLVGFRRLGGEISLLSSSDVGAGPFFAFCGLGNPDAFFRDLRDWGLAICGHMVFPDHHRYTEEDVLQIQLGAKRAGANAFVTTEKDEQNLGGAGFDRAPVYISVIDLAVSPETDFKNALDQTLQRSAGAAA
jgi:tetraacyldisaccharide 4'-kinase